MIKIIILFFGLIIGLIFFLIWAGQKNELLKYSENGIVEFNHNFTSDVSSDHSLKISTYNMGYASGMLNNKGVKYNQRYIEENLDEIVSTLKPYQLDILALQEIDFDSHRSFNKDQLEYLAGQLGFSYAAYQINWNVKYLPWPGIFPSNHFKKVVSGQVILSKYPILQQEIKVFKKPRGNSFWYNWFYLDRSLQMIEIKHPQKEINLWNTHLEAFDIGARKKQFQDMGNLLEASNKVVDFILGDFNSLSYRCEKSLFPEFDDSLIDFMDRTKYLNAEANIETDDFQCSFPSDDPSEKIDHILYRSSIDLINHGVIQLNASDHLPVWAEFKI